MVRLHVVNNEIIGRSSAQPLFKIHPPLFAHAFVNGIHHCNFFVNDEV